MKTASTLAAALAGALLAAPAAQADDNMLQQGTTLQLSAREEVSRVPDIAMISAGVMTEAPTAQQAMADNRAQMNRAFAVLRRAGIADKDMQTSGLSMQPRYHYKENEPPRLIGYQVTNMLSLRLRDLARVGAVLDALVEAGINQIDGPSFTLDAPQSALDEARQAAMKTAMARANLYAEAAGLRVKRIITISESGQVSPPRPMRAMAREEMMVASAPTPIAAGEVDLVATVNVTFELE